MVYGLDYILRILQKQIAIRFSYLLLELPVVSYYNTRMNDVLSVISRSVIVYLFIVIAIRLLGKKELSQLSVLNLVLILLIANAVQNAMVGSNTTLLGGLVAAASLFAIDYMLEHLISRSKKLEGIVQGHPIMLIYHGRVIEQNIQKVDISPDELEAGVREHGVSAIKDVDLAVLEVDGNMSVLANNFQTKTVRRRIPRRMRSGGTD